METQPKNSESRNNPEIFLKDWYQDHYRGLNPTINYFLPYSFIIFSFMYLTLMEKKNKSSISGNKIGYIG